MERCQMWQTWMPPMWPGQWACPELQGHQHVYESAYTLCNPKGKPSTDDVQDRREQPSIYTSNMWLVFTFLTQFLTNIFQRVPHLSLKLGSHAAGLILSPSAQHCRGAVLHKGWAFQDPMYRVYWPESIDQFFLISERLACAVTELSVDYERCF